MITAILRTVNCSHLQYQKNCQLLVIFTYNGIEAVIGTVLSSEICSGFQDW